MILADAEASGEIFRDVELASVPQDNMHGRVSGLQGILDRLAWARVKYVQHLLRLVDAHAVREFELRRPREQRIRPP